MGVRGQRSSEANTSDEGVEEKSGRREDTEDNAGEDGVGGEAGEGSIAGQEEGEGRDEECNCGEVRSSQTVREGGKEGDREG